MASAKSCCVPDCGKSRSNNVSLHSFPDPIKEAERFTTWINAVGSTICTLDAEYIIKNRRICHDHFEEKYLTWTKKFCIGAIPTIAMPGKHPANTTPISNQVEHVEYKPDINNLLKVCKKETYFEDTTKEVNVKLKVCKHEPHFEESTKESKNTLKVCKQEPHFEESTNESNNTLKVCKQEPHFEESTKKVNTILKVCKLEPEFEDTPEEQ